MKLNFQIEETYFKSYLKNTHSQDTSILYSFFWIQQQYKFFLEGREEY